MPPKYWHVRGVSFRPRVRMKFPVLRYVSHFPSSSKDQVASMLLQVVSARWASTTQAAKRGRGLGCWCEKYCSQAYHCVEAAGGVAVRRGPLPLSLHLRFPTRVSRCDGMALLSCPAVTIMLLCLFRYASTDRYGSTQVDDAGEAETYMLAAGISADHQTPASDSKPYDSQSH
jgi:hypothetical protein